MARLVASVLVRNEDVFIERAIRNVAAVCDKIHVVDQESTDRTGEILRSLARELDHLDVVRSSDASDSHRALEEYAGTETWVLGVDGDELYDQRGLVELKAQLLGGAHADVFRLKGHVLNSDELDLEAGTASGYLAPPSRPVTKLFNMAALESWTGCLERLHGGEPMFRSGYDWDSMRYLSEERDWDADPLRLLHVCFLRRSSVEDHEPGRGRPSLWETGEFRRGLGGLLKKHRYLRHVDPRIREYNKQGRNWKDEWYRRGSRVTIDATPFIGVRPL
ncbi:MAG: glycosyltransferase family 2 protein [Thermoleophilia bacterium]|nr:glycosyltransferase family 2 protein [Thermoleophilia bacterium]